MSLARKLLAAQPAAGGTLSGGTVTNVGGYSYHTFTTSGTLTVTGSVEVDYLVVAGGGGGGGNVGGGGGAGGFVSASDTLTASQTITVGTGGGGGAANNAGTNGSDSSLGSVAAATGGGGGAGNVGGTSTAGDGGSGGGGGIREATPTGGSGTVGQGFDGGVGQTSSSFDAAGGGGGASEVGGNSGTSPVIGGVGGDGLEWPTSSGTYYAGGGGGSTLDSDEQADGGLGGGGIGGVQYRGTAAAGDGAANTGGGGGGGSGDNGVGGDGGSGIVIVRTLGDAPPFDPVTAFDWHSVFSAEGDAFTALGLSDGASVTTWPNETGESDATGGTAPTYDAAVTALNGQPAVNFSTQYLVTGAFGTGPSSTLVSHVIICQATSNPAAYCPLSADTDKPKVYGAGTTWYAYTGALITGATADTAAHLLVGVFSSTGDDDLYLDGTLDATGNAGSTLSTTSLTIGRNAISTQYWPGPISFAGVFDGDITADASWPDFLVYCDEHWGLPTNEFDVETDIAWHSLFYAGGTAFQALGLSDGASVTTWPDEISTNDLGGGNAPTYSASEINGQSAVLFDRATSDYLQHTTWDVATLSPLSFVMVLRHDGALNITADHNAMGWDGTTGSGPGSSASGKLWLDSAATDYWASFGGSVLYSSSPPSNSAQLVTSLINGSSSTITVDGTEVAAGNAGTAAALAFNATLSAGASANSWDGPIAFFGIFEGNITSDDNYDAFIDWVSTTYGITIA